MRGRISSFGRLGPGPPEVDRLSSSLDGREEFGEFHLQSIRQSFDVDEREVPRPALDVAQIGPVDAGPVGQILLGQPEGLAPRFDGEPEALADIGVAFPFSHPPRIASCRLSVYRR